VADALQFANKTLLALVAAYLIMRSS